MSDCQSIDCCETPIYQYGLTAVYTPGPPIVDPPVEPVYRLMFYDDFNGENGGVPINDWNGWINWMNFLYFELAVVDRVDLRDYTTFGYPGSLAPQRLFVDMLGSSQYPPGVLQTIQEFTFTPGTYRLSFLLAGSQIGEDLTLQVQIGTGFADQHYAESGYVFIVMEQSFSVPAAQPFTLQTTDFTVTIQQTGRIKFYCAQPTTGVKNAGVLVDDVKLEQIA